jgi:cytochrome c biogenesis protein CcmG, thiol:disulfide interchange protein DsbE
MTARRCLPLAVAALLLLGACHHGADRSSPASSASPAMNATVAPGLPTTVDELPVTDVPRFHSLLQTLRGTPVVVNAWASWCAPCQAEAPLLRAAAKARPDVQFLGIDILDSREGAETFIADQAIPYPSVFDPPGAIRTDLGGIGQPVTFFYDARGRQVAVVDGELSRSALDRHLAEISQAS